MTSGGLTLQASDGDKEWCKTGDHHDAISEGSELELAYTALAPAYVPCRQRFLGSFGRKSVRTEGQCRALDVVRCRTVTGVAFRIATVAVMVHDQPMKTATFELVAYLSTTSVRMSGICIT
jgi:hypothetical protein